MQKVIIATLIILVIIQIAWSNEGPSYSAFSIDVSGSMKKHGFSEAKTQVMEYLNTMESGTYFWIIPFSENDMPAFEAEITETNRDAVLKEAETFINGLDTGGKRGDKYGFLTNIDEGVDAAKLAVLQQPGPGKRNIVLISDGISEPDIYHHPVNIEEIAKKIPNSVNLYLVDINGSGEQFPAEWKKPIGSIEGYQVPQSSVVIIPAQADEIKEMLNQLDANGKSASKIDEGKTKPAIEAPVVPKPSLWNRAYPWLKLALAIAAIVGVLCLIMVAVKKTKESRRKMDNLTQQKEAILKRNTQRKSTEFMVISIAGKTKSFPIKPFASIRFGTQETFDFPITDPDKGHIDGWLKVNESGKVALINGASTFPFMINDKIEVPRGKEHVLPDQANIQVSKRLNLNFRIELNTDAVTANSVDDLIKKYQPKEVA